MGPVFTEDDAAAASLVFLQSCVHPWDTVLDHWNKTFRLRWEDRDLLSIAEYFKKYPALQQARGFTLVSSPLLFHFYVWKF